MDFAAAAEANDFLLSQIVRQAEAEGETYSELELELLRWPRSELTIEEEDAMPEKQEGILPADFSFLPLSRKAARHLRIAHAAGLDSDPNAGARFELAYAALRGTSVLLAGFTHRDASILAMVMALRLGSLYEALSAMVGAVLTPYSLSRPHPTRVVTVVAVSTLAAGVVLGLFLWLR
jgi:hypothetical protein